MCLLVKGMCCEVLFAGHGLPLGKKGHLEAVLHHKGSGYSILFALGEIMPGGFYICCAMACRSRKLQLRMAHEASKASVLGTRTARASTMHFKCLARMQDECNGKCKGVARQ